MTPFWDWFTFIGIGVILVWAGDKWHEWSCPYKH